MKSFVSDIIEAFPGRSVILNEVVCNQAFPGQRLVKKHWVLFWKLVGYRYNFYNHIASITVHTQTNKIFYFSQFYLMQYCYSFKLTQKKKKFYILFNALQFSTHYFFTILFNTVSKNIFTIFI